MAAPTPTVPTPKNFAYSENFNRYTPRDSSAAITNRIAAMPSAIIPKTTNKTAGSTPYVNVSNLQKRKLNFDENMGGAKVRMSPNRRSTVISDTMKKGMTFMFYEEHEDGWVSTFTAKGKPSGYPGYIGDAFNLASKSLQDPRYSDFAQLLILSTIIPKKDKVTSNAKMYSYEKTEHGRVETIAFPHKCFVQNKLFLPDDMSVSDWCRHQVDVINGKYNLNLIYGGNARPDGSQTLSLDSEFVAADVATLAFSLYEDAIKDGSFFHDQTLLKKYFRHHTDVVALFQKLELI